MDKAGFHFGNICQDVRLNGPPLRLNQAAYSLQTHDPFDIQLACDVHIRALLIIVITVASGHHTCRYGYVYLICHSHRHPARWVPLYRLNHPGGRSRTDWCIEQRTR